MAYEKKPLTDHQRSALKPAVDKLENAFDELEKTLTSVGVRRSDDDTEFGFCFRCPKQGRQELCSAFLGPGRTQNENCQREFCGQPRKVHS
jgi:hypothetical protein